MAAGLDSKYDVIVVGAGPGGSTTAGALAKQGWKVALLDKEPFPRFKACGGLVTDKVLETLSFPMAKEVVERSVHGLRLWGKRGKSITRIDPNPLGIVVKREIFDYFLVEEAIKAGADFFPSTGLEGLNQGAFGLHLQTSRGRLTTDQLIGADGVFSTVCKLAKIRKPFRKSELGFTLSTTITGQVTADDQHVVELYCVPLLAGFGWAFPQKEGYNIGIGCSRSVGKKIYPFFQHFLKKIKQTKGLQGRGQVKGHCIPAGGFKRPVASDNIVLVGDAAGFGDPFSGEGIYHAVRSGLIAAEQVRLAQENKHHSLGYNYTKACYREFLLDSRLSLMLAFTSGDKEGLVKEAMVDELMTIMHNPNTYYQLYKRKLLPLPQGLRGILGQGKK